MRVPLAIAVACLAVSCSFAGATPRAAESPSPSASPTISPIVVGPPADRVLVDPVPGLALTDHFDHLDLTEAASEQQNQPLALTRYRAWGWVDEAYRHWQAGPPPRPFVNELLLLLTREEGARLAFSDLRSQRLLGAKPCPSGLGLDECVLGSFGGGDALIGRAGVYLIQLSSSGEDLGPLAAAQVARLRS